MTKSQVIGFGKVGGRVKVTWLALLMLLAAAGGCDTFVPAPQPNTPTGNFEALWKEFDARYALFAVRAVDWDSLGAVLAPRVRDDMLATELFLVMCDLLAPLADRHVSLVAPDVSWFNSGYAASAPYFPDGLRGDYSLELVQQRSILRRYLDAGSAGFHSGNFATVAAGYAGGRRLLYLELQSMRDDGSVDWARVDSCLAAAPDCDGLILDLRASTGGLHSNQARVLDSLAESARTYGSKRSRNGPGRQDFGPPVDSVMTPTGTGWGLVPVVVLTDPNTASASEWLALGLSYRAGATIVGTRTMGIFSSRSEFVLPNGWSFTCSGDLMADAEGRCLEALGVPPDLEIRNTAAANRTGRDLAMDAALTLLGGTPMP
jgi:carboxyl-terminal processing protease